MCDPIDDSTHPTVLTDLTDLTVLAVTRFEPEVKPTLQQLVIDTRKLGAKLLLAVDGDASVVDWSLLDNHPFKRVIFVNSLGYIESVLDEALSHVDTEYVLRLDDDECMSTGMLDWLADRGYLLAHNWKFPRMHMWGESGNAQCLVNPPLWPDHQTRLSIVNLAGGRKTIHSSSPHGWGELAPCTIEHYKFLLKPLSARRAIIDRYESAQPGAGVNFRVFSAPEDVLAEHAHAYYLRDAVDLETEARAVSLPGLVPLAIARAFDIGMHQHHAEISEFARWLITRSLHHVIEIGGLKGGTASLFHALSTGTVVSVDLPNGRFGGADHGLDEAACQARNASLRATHPRFHGVLGNSHDTQTFKQVQSALNHQLADLLFIDGDHTLQGVRADYYMYRELVRPGGIIAFHDINATKFHEDAGCLVHEFWRELGDVPKAAMTINADWGGIGVTFA